MALRDGRRWVCRWKRHKGSYTDSEFSRRSNSRPFCAIASRRRTQWLQRNKIRGCTYWGTATTKNGGSAGRQRSFDRNRLGCSTELACKKAVGRLISVVAHK